MNVHPYAIFIRRLTPAIYDAMYKNYKDNPMRCVIINLVTKDRTYIDGHFVDIEYQNNALKLNYICIDLVAGMVGIQSMDSHCYVTYNGKKYYDMVQLYKDFTYTELIKEIDSALD